MKIEKMGKKLRHARKARGFKNRHKMIEKANNLARQDPDNYHKLNYNSVILIEQGKRFPSVPTLITLARVNGVSIDYLIDDEIEV